MIFPRMRALIPGSARASRAGDGAPAIRNFFPYALRGAERSTRGRVRSPIIAAALCTVSLVFAGTSARAAEVIPPKPDGYFNDYAHVVSTETASRLNEQLAQFERDSGTQLVVAVFPKMQSDSSVEDYTYRIKDAWKVGQKGLNNGAALFVFIEDRKMWIQTGYGLEGALPDAVCFDIYNNVIRPKFKANDYAGGLTGGVNAMIAAVRGEYKGSGKTALESQGSNKSPLPLFIFFIIFVIVLIRIIHAQRKGGYGYSSLGGPLVGGWGVSGGGWCSGSCGGGGFSGFSGGGGIGGGGGAGGGW